MASAGLLHNRFIDLCLPVAKEHSSNTMSSHYNVPESATTESEITFSNFSTNDRPRPGIIKFGSKEAYPHKSETSPIQEHLNMAKSVHSIIRHGYRYPSVKDMENFKILFPEHEFRWVPSDGSQLTENGKKEQQRLGRVLSKFLTKNSDFYCSSKSRSLESAEEFLKLTDFSATIDDKLVRYYDYCKNYVSNYTKASGSRTEEDIKVSEYTNAHNITQIESYQHRICAYEQFIYGQSEFEGTLRRDLSILSDIELWEKCGLGGGKRNWQMATVVLERLVGFIEANDEKIEENGKISPSLFVFGHAETVLPLICILKLVEEFKNWNMSEMAPSSANVMFIVSSEVGNPVRIAINEQVHRVYASMDDFKRDIREKIVENYEQLDEAVYDRRRRSEYWDKV